MKLIDVPFPKRSRVFTCILSNGFTVEFNISLYYHARSSTRSLADIVKIIE